MHGFSMNHNKNIGSARLLSRRWVQLTHAQISAAVENSQPPVFHYLFTPTLIKNMSDRSLPDERTMSRQKITKDWLINAILSAVNVSVVGSGTFGGVT